MQPLRIQLPAPQADTIIPGSPRANTLGVRAAALFRPSGLQMSSQRKRVKNLTGGTFHCSTGLLSPALQPLGLPGGTLSGATVCGALGATVRAAKRSNRARASGRRLLWRVAHCPNGICAALRPAADCLGKTGTHLGAGRRPSTCLSPLSHVSLRRGPGRAKARQGRREQPRVKSRQGRALGKEGSASTSPARGVLPDHSTTGAPSGRSCPSMGASHPDPSQIQTAAAPSRHGPVPSLVG